MLVLVLWVLCADRVVGVVACTVSDGVVVLRSGERTSYTHTHTHTHTHTLASSHPPAATTTTTTPLVL